MLGDVDNNSYKLRNKLLSTNFNKLLTPKKYYYLKQIS